MLTEREAELLLDELCCQLGFCLPPDKGRILKENPPADVSSFADAVFLAEGIDPSAADRHLYRQVCDMIAKAFRNQGH